MTAANGARRSKRSASVPLIEVDESTYALLLARARPPFEAPADALRRMLLGSPAPQETPEAVPRMGRSALAASLLDGVAGPFAAVGGFPDLLEAEDQILYVLQARWSVGGFNPQRYAIARTPWEILVGSIGRRRGHLALVAGPGREAYLLPFADVMRRMTAVGRNDCPREIAIDRWQHRWIELDWPIGRYLRAASRSPAMLTPSRS